MSSVVSLSEVREQRDFYPVWTRTEKKETGVREWRIRSKNEELIEGRKRFDFIQLDKEDWSDKDVEIN